MTELYNFSFQDLKQRPRSLAEFKDQVLLIVNTASQCGFTPQLTELEALYQKYQAQGLVIIGFPCNQFMKQEPLSGQALQDFCERHHGVTFVMADKIEVNGPGAHPLWRYLKAQRRGLLGSSAIKWNFTKFLINRDGQVVNRFAPKTPPADLEAEIEACL
ncbi:MAG: glutathione peroxidase [Neisseriaceae bacterium]|nr:glutathione peroxidase [Neisseriaceae bacterium]MBP6861860.1 glutathione peroxidase [Neisseriaceae bacterium]